MPIALATLEPLQSLAGFGIPGHEGPAGGSKRAHALKVHDTVVAHTWHLGFRGFVGFWVKGLGSSVAANHHKKNTRSPQLLRSNSCSFCYKSNNCRSCWSSPYPRDPNIRTSLHWALKFVNYTYVWRPTLNPKNRKPSTQNPVVPCHGRKKILCQPPYSSEPQQAPTPLT